MQLCSSRDEVIGDHLCMQCQIHPGTGGGPLTSGASQFHCNNLFYTNEMYQLWR